MELIFKVAILDDSEFACVPLKQHLCRSSWEIRPFQIKISTAVLNNWLHILSLWFIADERLEIPISILPTPACTVLSISSVSKAQIILCRKNFFFHYLLTFTVEGKTSGFLSIHMKGA